MFDSFKDVNWSKRETMGKSLQNLYIFSNGFFTILGSTEFISSNDDSSTEVNAGHASPLSVPSIVGSLKHTIYF